MRIWCFSFKRGSHFHSSGIRAGSDCCLISSVQWKGRDALWPLSLGQKRLGKSQPFFLDHLLRTQVLSLLKETQVYGKVITWSPSPKLSWAQTLSQFIPGLICENEEATSPKPAEDQVLMDQTQLSCLKYWPTNPSIIKWLFFMPLILRWFVL